MPIDDPEYDRVIMRKRMKSLVETWEGLSSVKRVFGGQDFVLNDSIAANTVHYYARDLNVLKRRYKVPDRVRAPRIAGLMAGSVLRHRPVVPIDGERGDVGRNIANEILAILHGLCICANYKPGLGAYNQAMEALIGSHLFAEWFNRFKFLLKERNYTSESLIMVFETLCLAAFPNSLLNEAVGD